MKLKNLQDLTITIKAGKIEHSITIIGKNELIEMLRYWKFPSFMKRYNKRIEIASQQFVAKLIDAFDEGHKCKVLWCDGVKHKELSGKTLCEYQKNFEKVYNSYKKR